ncbi:heparinase II/III domain-containing protein [Thaumasiovibrio subtropicus]|uniref:heparinase II/III domain-containing protein n=1 Tax=Thaumasiovibrio subtropicus TaxID=1891207 RepID=UPI000B3591EB|nr:heparinase II/III family protein [Thaumasiovibrio subtropicus]
MTDYQPLLMTMDEAAALREDLGKETLMGKALARDIAKVQDYIATVGIEVPGHGEAGGYEHNRHKQNYIHMDIAGRLFLITEEAQYRDYIRDLLVAYAEVYPSLELNISRDTNHPGRLFHQTLNENMWMLYSSCAYSCIHHTLSADERTLIENDLFRIMVEMFVDTYAHDFDIIHNHGLWAVAAVGICGYAIQCQDTVGKALYGLKGDSVSGGFLAQLSQLFSPDGYYMEGPYYHRFSLRPIHLFAEVIERRQPEVGIFAHKDGVIQTTTYAVMSTAFPDGTLPALNDSSKTMDINDEGILIGTSVCFERYEEDANLLAMANHQQDVWVHIAGKKLSDAVAATESIPAFDWGSLYVTDGPEGDKGGLTILRHRDANEEDTMALLWFGQHGSDHQYHSALDHGHYDGLHLSIFNRGQEVTQDYGFGRWVNIEPKFGGRYIPENKSYCKQTIAHNTVVVDKKTQNNFDTATAESKWGELHFFNKDNKALQSMSGIIRGYYDGVDMQRTVLVAELEGIARPVVVDLFRLISEETHSYDYPVHHIGQLIRTDFDYQANNTLAPMGEDNGYQHLWQVAQGEVEGSTLVSWLHGESYYSMVSSAPAGSEVIFARLGANDPDFNLRSEPAFVLRQQGKTHLFANVLETHGYFNEAIEASTEARGLIERVEVVGMNDTASVVRLHRTDGKVHTLGVSNQTGGAQDGEHNVSFNGETFSWTGNVAML